MPSDTTLTECNTRLIQVIAPYFCAGIDATRAAPIIRYMGAWPTERIQSYCRSKGWRMSSLLP